MSKAQVQVPNPILLAILSNNGSSAPRPAMLDRAADATVDGITAATRFAGQVTVAFDSNNFSDGVKKQKLRSYTKRNEFWQAVGAQYNLTDAEVAQIIAA